MRVLAVASQKGGSGKTTLAGHLAVQAELAGAGPVALVDMDPQGSLSGWWNERTEARPYFAQTSIDTLADDIAEMQAVGIRLLVIDTPPAIAATIAHVIQLSDLVLVPMRPSPHDLRAANATIRLVEALGKPMVFVINAAQARARATAETVAALSGSGVLAPPIIHHRADFASSMTDGRTVMEIPGSERAAMEIGALWEYLRRRVLPAEPETPSAGPAGSIATPPRGDPPAAGEPVEPP